MCVFGWSSVIILAVYANLWGQFSLLWGQTLWQFEFWNVILKSFLMNRTSIVGLCGLVTFATSVISFKIMIEVTVGIFLVLLFQTFIVSLVSSLSRTCRDFLLLCSCVVSFQGARKLWSPTRICAGTYWE